MAYAETLTISTDTVDDRRFEDMVLSHKRSLFLLALSILRNPAEAEEAVQESLLKAWRAWERFPASDDIAASRRWVTRICVNHCISHRRTLLRRGFFSQQEPGADLVALNPFRGEGRLVDLDRAYQNLSRKQRAALTLTYFHGYSDTECAELMGCGAGSVRTHVARGLRGLRREMTHD